jgi:hypothetical protein
MPKEEHEEKLQMTLEPQLGIHGIYLRSSRFYETAASSRPVKSRCLFAPARCWLPRKMWVPIQSDI